MEITIDDYIKIIKTWLYKGTDGLTNTRLGYMEGWFHKTDKEAFETAIKIMRKYQKIVQIMERTVDDGTSMYDTLQEIEEVLEDGT